MASQALMGIGIHYMIDDGTNPTTPVFEEIAEVFDVTPPNQQTEEIEVTHYGSTGGYREFIAGLKDGGEIDMQLNWIPGNATDVFLRDLHASGDRRIHKIGFPNSAEMKFEGWVKGFERGTPLDDRMTATVTIRVTGDSTYVDPTP